MLIPWDVEPPPYAGASHARHYPWVTIALIVANTIVFFVTGMGSDEGIEAWGLEYGAGLQPVQWVTRNFMHGGFVHLIGNMFFLWVFGMVVEGKIGWWKFLIVYLGLAVLQAALEQCWFDHGRTIGASAVIFALLGMALIWAPENEVQCVWIYSGFTRYGSAEVEISVLWMAIFYIGSNLLYAGLKEFQLSSEFGHAFGALLGIALAVAMLRLKWVDCEGWDVFTSMSGRFMKSRSAKKKDIVARPVAEDDRQANPNQSAAERFIEAQKQFRKLLTAGNASAALALYEKTSHFAVQWQLAEKELLVFVDRLCAENLFNEAVPFLEDYLRRFEKRLVQARLKLAQILIEHQQRPSYALRVLEGLPQATLPENYARLRTKLERQARKMIDDGVLELEGRAW